jgi:glycerate dehydrogenase
MNIPRCTVLDGSTLTEHMLGTKVVAGEPTWDALSSMVELSVYPRTDAQTLLDRACGQELLLTNKVLLDGQAIGALPSLRYVGILATGTNVVDLEAAKQRGIVVTNVPGYATESVVAHVFGLILELEMRMAEHALAVREGRWCQSADFSFRLGSTLELANRTLGIIGFGSIGRRVAAVGQAFGMRVIVALRPGSRANLTGATAHMHFLPLDKVFAEADVVTLHCPLVPETRELVDARRLSLMKPNAILINTGRGPLVDELALADCLAQGRIRGAGLDVLCVEPPPLNHPLLHAPRCLITPHLAWATTAARERLMQVVTANVKAYLDGQPTNRVA